MTPRTPEQRARRDLLRRVEAVGLRHEPTGSRLHVRGWQLDAAVVYICSKQRGQEPLGYVAWDDLARVLDTRRLPATAIRPIP